MVNFVVKNQDLINFLVKASAKGVITISNTEKETSTFFNKFFLEATGNILEIKALDSQGGTMWGLHRLSGVEVEEEGMFAVTDAEILLELLKSISGKRLVNFYYDEDKPLTITTADDGPFKGFEIREWVSMSPKEIEKYNKNVIVFIGAHSFSEESVPIIGDNPDVGTYSTILRLKKSDLIGVINQTIKLTMDQDVEVIMDKEGNVSFLSGKSNALIKSKDIFYDVTENPVVFDQKFGNLQPIIPMLYEDIVIYMRKASDGKMKWWIRSKSGQIELNFVTGAL